MNTIVQIKEFNEVLDKFFNFIDSNFPLFKSELILVKSQTEFLRRNNPRLVVEKIIKPLIPFKKQLMECDEKFFLDYEKMIDKNDVSKKDLIKIMKIKNIWNSPNTTDKQKAYLWYYLQNLIKTGERVIKNE